MQIDFDQIAINHMNTYHHINHMKINNVKKIWIFYIYCQTPVILDTQWNFGKCDFN